MGQRRKHAWRLLWPPLLATVAMGACVHDKAKLVEAPVCADGQTSCDGGCVDTQFDPLHCGVCGNVCSGDDVCSLGMCAAECMGGTTQCDALCVNPDSDPNHCGNCTTRCDSDQVCAMGVCAADCPATTTDCSGACIDPMTDASHCGGCNMPCESGESCAAGNCIARDCLTLLQNDPSLVDGLYTIDPDGPGGQPPFEVTCNMSTDGGGWIELGLANSDSLYMAESSASNGFDKCSDDSAKHFDWISENAVTPDYSGNAVNDVSLDYLNPGNMAAYTVGQMNALRSIVTELSSTTRMVAVVADDDSGDWQTSMTSGHEVYIMGQSMMWTLLSPGESGNCTTSSGQAGYYLWHNTAAASVVGGTTGLTNNDLGGLGIGDLLPLQVRLVIATGGGVAFGFEKETILVR